ncbi:hypothetical protein KZX29_04275 [Moraxella osloensis]|uniref:hypothetical protein n=1 Tax=Faucicola osloensis TaxID=34062 RepID=UPI0020064C78|nr:hypothetical protein [Moraxella osloensis]MCK6158013.1 hypothetical protein [Moraxella osloensis]
MSDQTQTTDAPVTDTTEQTITPEQYQALQDEVEKLRKHSETLLAEKKAEQQKQREAQAEKDALAQEQARKKGDFDTLEKQYQDKIAKLEAEIVERDKQRDSDLVKSEALKLASSLSDNEHNQAILQMLIEKRLTAENGQVKVVDDLGNATISTIADLKNEISTSGKFDSLITGTKASGVGATGQGTQGTKQASDYTESERIELATTNPNLFNQLFAQKE